ELAAVTRQLGPGVVIARPGLQGDLADAADRRQRLAAKTERLDAEQVVRIPQFARGVAGERERQIVGQDAAAVVDDANQLGAALLDVDVDARAAGVDAVFQQFLDDAGRPLDDFAGGDLGDHGVRQLLDTTHKNHGIHGKHGKENARGQRMTRSYWSLG